jgi:deazaflavin-dependent oxidoreductase (nitroreductase family)
MIPGMPDFAKINADVIEEYRATGGQVGGMFAGETLVLLHHLGARSGVERVSPLAFHAEGDRMFVIASKAGLNENPAWYHNLLAHPDVTVELGSETIPVRAEVVTGTERDEIYARNAAVRPQFAEYQANVDRVIPVVELVRR